MKKKILLLMVSLLLLAGCGVATIRVKGGVAKIKPTAASQVTLEEYTNGLINILIPKGWKVEVAPVDYIHYAFKVYNPENPDYMILFGLKQEGFLKTEKARAWYAKTYPSAAFGKIQAIDPQTTEAFYKVWYKNADYSNKEGTKDNFLPLFKDFTVVENLGTLSLGGDILRATYNNDKGELMQGLFTATVYSSGTYKMYGIDFAPLNVYHIIAMTAPDDDFVNWQAIYDKSVGSLSFTEEFMKNFNKQESQLVNTVKANQKIYDSISDMIMDSWNKRSNSYDIISQKRSDATLGYERVYDTQTGDVYRTYNGFTDEYSGNRYESVTDDMYSKTISGYIYK